MALEEERFSFQLRYADVDSERSVAPHTMQELLITACSGSQVFRRLHEGGLVYPQRRHSLAIARPRPTVEVSRSMDFTVEVGLWVLGSHGRFLVVRASFGLRDAASAAGAARLGELAAVAVCVEAAGFRRRDVPPWVPSVGPAWVPYLQEGLALPAQGPPGVAGAEGAASFSEEASFVVPRWHTDALGHVTNSMYGRYFWEALRARAPTFDVEQPVQLDIEFRREVKAGDHAVLLVHQPGAGATGVPAYAVLSVNGKLCTVARWSCGEDARPPARL